MEIRYLEKTIVYGAVKWVAEIIYIVGELSFARYRALYKWSLTLIYCQFFAAFLLLNFIWRKLWYLTLVMIPWDTYFNLKIRESNCHKQHRQNYEHSTPMINIGNICPSFFNFEIKSWCIHPELSLKTCKENKGHQLFDTSAHHECPSYEATQNGIRNICIYFFFQIISANVSTANHQPVSLDDVQLPLKVQFTYSVMWSSTK